MTSLRGDDDIMSLMDVMASRQGYQTKNSGCDEVPTTDAHLVMDESHDKVRLTEEVTGYSTTNKVTSDFPNYENGKEYIWNPFVHVTIESPTNNKMMIVSTNPEVEVHRRRSYEKFKKKFYTIFNFIANNVKKNHQQADNEKISEELLSFWTKLPTHSIWERFHFICKLEENLMAAQKNRKLGITDHFPDSNQLEIILAATIKAKSNGTIVDPILISSSNGITSKGNVGQKNHVTTPLSSLLHNEIVFQWKREWRRFKSKEYKTNEEKMNKELETFFLTKRFKKTVHKIVRDINVLAGEIELEFIKNLQKRVAINSSSSHGRKGRNNKKIPRLSPLTFEHSDEDMNTNVTCVEYSGLSLRINDTHLEKLRILFDRNNQSSKSLASHEAAFHSALFALLARYDMLEGAGLQSSLNENVFDVLLCKFDCKTECFASPFNCRYERYCSAFPDTDMSFGSLGSFFEYDFKSLTNGGCFQANPPFVADFIVRMYKRIEDILTDDNEDETTVPLMFIIFIPAWKETNGWNALNTSSFLSRHVFLSQKNDPHFYCEGTQHRRSKARYRIASFDTVSYQEFEHKIPSLRTQSHLVLLKSLTIFSNLFNQLLQSVFFLQNKQAKLKWPVTNDAIDELKLAFSINPEEKSLNLIKTKVKLDSSTTKHSHDEMKDSASVENQTNSTKTMSKKRRQKTPKQSQKKKKLVDESGTRELEILASLGIPSHKSDEQNFEMKEGRDNTVDIAKGKGTTKRNKRNRRKKSIN